MSIVTRSAPITQVDTSPLYEPGSICIEEADANPGYGERTWIYVRFVSTTPTTAAVVGCALSRTSSVTIVTGEEPAAVLPREMILGVVQHEIADGSYSWILKEGVGTIKAAGSTVNSGGRPIFPEAGGDFVDLVTAATVRAAIIAGGIASADVEDYTPYQLSVCGASIGNILTTATGLARIKCG